MGIYDNPKVIGARIRKLRKDAGYKSREAFGEALKEDKPIDRKTIARWEEGERLPDLEILLQMCDMFECDLDYILGRLKEPRSYDNQFIMDETGLTEDAIMLLKVYKKNSRHNEWTDDPLGTCGANYTAVIPDFISYMLTLTNDNEAVSVTVLSEIFATLHRQRVMESFANEMPPFTRKICQRAHTVTMDALGSYDPNNYKLSCRLKYGQHREEIEKEFPGQTAEEILHTMMSYYEPLRSLAEKDLVEIRITNMISKMIHDYLDKE